MKRRITFSLAVALIAVSVSLMRSDSTVNAQNQIRTLADTGVITLGPNQELRLTVIAGSPIPGGAYNYSFRQINYTQGTCADGVCKHAITSQTTTLPIALLPSGSVTFSCNPDSVNIVRVLVLSNSRDARVNAMIIDTVTGDVVSFTTDLVIDVSG